jgi:O-antigen ligase
MLIIATIASIYNLISKRKKEKLSRYLFFPFIIYFLSIIISFIIDVFHNQFDGEFIFRNLSVLIIPLFIFTSNFSKTQTLDILKKTSIFITLVGVFFLVLWVFGYYKYNNQQEFQKKEWFKNEIITPQNYLTKTSSYNVIIKPTAENPSLRKVVMLKEKQAESVVVREFTVKVEKNKKDVWVLLRNVNDGNCKAWFNATNGEIGKIEGDAKIKSEKLLEGFYKFTLANKPKKSSTREWFYVSFVSNNGSYVWNNNLKKDLSLQLKTPNLFLDTGTNLLEKRSLFKYKITTFSGLEKYAHSTYLGLIFIFALIIFMFNPILNKWLRFIAITLNIIFLITLASKAIILSLIFLIPIYYLYNYFNYKLLIAFVALGVFIGFSGHVKERFNDMFQTVFNLNQEENLGDLKALSTNNRISIYKNYFDLIKNNYAVGYGYKNAEGIIKSKFDYNFNTHNQYLQSLFHAGIIGFFLLILFCISPFLLKRKKMKKKYGLELLILLILFNFLFESLLFRQWGLIFVCFTYAIYFQFFKSELKWFR